MQTYNLRQVCARQGWHENINDSLYISDIYIYIYDIIMIFSSGNIIIYIIENINFFHYVFYYLFTFLIHLTSRHVINQCGCHA